MIAKQSFGRTGHMSTRTIFGAAALGTVTQDKADRIMELLMYYEINHIDTAPMYGDAELYIGSWMERHRQKFFLATKTEKRTYEGAWEQFMRSLETLRVDQVDLLQLHDLVDPEEWKLALGMNGALEAAIEARRQGLTRFIGVTGHGMTAPAMHQRSLEYFGFDAVLLPYNYVMMQNAKYAADFEALMALCQERNVAVQTTKSIARGSWGNKTRIRTTWYEPLENQDAIDKAVHWVMGQPKVFLNTLGDVQLLPKVLEAASRFRVAPSEKVMERLAAKQKMAPIFGPND
ncbi:MAG: aldo/keto reductase [Chloroflexi bacterium]|nr:MAG: aldo/keto reductase [Chloroflexota bacterium]RLC83886.1 MAG: aldo/keto reductase [Chloroflexota bacterium]